LTRLVAIIQKFMGRRAYFAGTPPHEFLEFPPS